MTDSLPSPAFLDRVKYLRELGYSIGEEERIILRTISPHVQKRSLNELLFYPKLELKGPSEARYGAMVNGSCESLRGGRLFLLVKILYLRGGFRGDYGLILRCEGAQGCFFGAHGDEMKGFFRAEC